MRHGRKGLDLTWNVLNLVSGAVMHGSDNHTDDSSLTYAWLSDGTKVSAVADDVNGNGVQKRYLGSFVYTSTGGSSAELPTEVESIAWDEGRIFFNLPEVEDPVGGVDIPVGEEAVIDSLIVVDTAVVAGWFRDCWYAADHLGNVRAVIDINPESVLPEILEQNDFLPYGTRIQNPAFATATDNRWRYAGKEEQHFASGSAAGSLNLSLLDFGARMYDPFTARWTVVDPLAKRLSILSPYVYCGGNPIRLFDPDGNTPRDSLKGLLMGFATNIVPGPNSRRDISGLDSKEDYNAGLKTADVTSAVVAGGMSSAGDAGLGAGTSMVVAGSSSALTVIGAPEGAAVATSGAIVIGGSTLLKAGGLAMAASTAKNAASGYNHGNTGETNYTKSGKDAHKNYNPGEGYKKEYQLPSRNRVDAINEELGIVRELKPNNPRAIKRGEKQVQKYVDELNRVKPRPDGKSWIGVVDTY